MEFSEEVRLLLRCSGVGSWRGKRSPNRSTANGPLPTLFRNRLKRVIGEVARYPTEHDEKSIPDRSLRCRMGLYRAPPPHSKVRRTPADPFSARDPRRRLLHRSQWLRLAPVTPRFPALEDRLPLLSPLAHRWHLGEAQCGHPPAPARAPRA